MIARYLEDVLDAISEIPIEMNLLVVIAILGSVYTIGPQEVLNQALERLWLFILTAWMAFLASKIDWIRRG